MIAERAIDLLISEDATMYRKFVTNTSAKALQTACMLLVLFLLVGVLVHDLAHRSASSQATPSPMVQQSGHPRITAPPDLHPNAQTP
jgi:hypothetical protein